MVLITCLGLFIWLIVLALPWRPWSTRERLEPAPVDATADFSDVTVLIPARDEAAVIGRTIAGLAAQGTGMRTILIDDQSTDDTAVVALDSGLEGLEVLSGAPLPPNWSGKLWALEQGRRLARTDLILLLDADIALAPGTLQSLRARMRDPDLGLASVMASLRMEGFWERMLLPAFIYFFKLLYPFHLANSASPLVAAAAGGCILIRRKALEDIGGFSSLREAMIDDCALARRVKRLGYRTWVGLSHAARSVRPYPGLAPIWDMVARNAYTQLRYSPVWLAVCSALMAAAFVAPVVSLAGPSIGARLAAVAALVAMMSSYLPTLRYFGLPAAQAITLPAVGVLYLAMTWTSALRYWRGERSRWKGRSYRLPG